MAKTKTSAAKARRAAAHPNRPGMECHAEPDTFSPRVDRARCEGKSDCVEVCPYSVFEVRTMDRDDFQGLSLLGKLRSIAHGRQTAYTPNAARCQACGLCVVACPEKALRLESVTARR